MAVALIGAGAIAGLTTVSHVLFGFDLQLICMIVTSPLDDLIFI